MKYGLPVTKSSRHPGHIRVQEHVLNCAFRRDRVVTLGNWRQMFSQCYNLQHLKDRYFFPPTLSDINVVKLVCVFVGGEGYVGE